VDDFPETAGPFPLMEWVHTFTVDASRNHQRGTTGIGLVVQGRPLKNGRPDSRRGPIIDQLSERHLGISPSADEAFAILRALEIAHERGYSRVRVRSDYNHERKQLRQRYREQGSATDPVRVRILELARRLAWVDFGYVPRRKNQLAHSLARSACITVQRPSGCPHPFSARRRARGAGLDVRDSIVEAEVFLEEDGDLDDEDDVEIPF